MTLEVDLREIRAQVPGMKQTLKDKEVRTLCH